MDDEWKKRSVRMRCVTCIYYVPKEGSGEVRIGRCRHHSPTMKGHPVVFEAHGWCGDHKLDENKTVES